MDVVQAGIVKLDCYPREPTYWCPKPRKYKYWIHRSSSKLFLTDEDGKYLLTLGNAQLTAPYEGCLRSKQCELQAQALVWLASNGLCTFELATFKQAEDAWTPGTVELLVSFLPPVFEATQSEALAHLSVLMRHFQASYRANLSCLQPGQAGASQHAPLGPACSTAPPEGGRLRVGDGGPSGLEDGVGFEEEDAMGVLPEPSALRDELFAMVLPSDWQREEPEPPGLRCNLYRYQRRALSWMLWRESFSGHGAAAGAVGDPDSVKAQLPGTSLAWQQVVLSGGAVVYWNPLEGQLSLQPKPPPFPQVPGGLLCDEMGLGKTVEIIALMLANRPPHTSTRDSADLPLSPPAHSPGAWPALAPSAAAAAGPSSSAAANRTPPSQATDGEGMPGLGQEGKPDGGTLVICPSTLLQQWRAELSNHAQGSLRVEVYDGMAALRPLPNDRKKPAQREAELYERMLHGGGVAPSFDPERDAQEAAERLRGADVVLTTFDILQREVYYSPNDRASGLRHAKRYAIPTCPLLQVHWWRLVVDEAQVVGPLSASGAMVEKMSAAHRWCVTGTPLHASHGLTDVHGLLHILKHAPFACQNAWNLLVATSYAQGDPCCWQLLRSLLRPLMWRNTKVEVAEEYRLPPRSLKVSYISFQSGEKEVYDQILESMRSTREQLRQEEAEEREQTENPDVVGSPVAAVRKRRRGEKLKEDATNRILQLRLACIHPQLTKHWQQLSSDLQLNMGGTLSMEEIMQRLVDKAQYELQEVERSLCAHLNTLAMVTLGSAGTGSTRTPKAAAGPPGPAPAAGAAAGAGAAAASGGAREAEGAAGPSAKKRRKPSQPLAELQQEALRLLEQSYRVGEKGIDALDTSLEAVTELDDITAAGGTIVAWRKLQVNTEHQLAALYEALGRAEDAEKIRLDLKEKTKNVKEHADFELSQAQTKLEALQKQAEEVTALLLSSWQEAARLDFPVESWGVTNSATDWLAELVETFHHAQKLEEEERETQPGNTKHILGEEVHKALGELEKHIQGELAVLEHYVDGAHLGEGMEQLHDAMRGISGAMPEQLDTICVLLRQQLRLLPAFKRKTLQAQWFWILPPDQPAQPASEPGRRSSEVAEAPQPDQHRPAPVAAQQPDPETLREEEEKAADYKAAKATAGTGAAYILSSRFLGMLPGYAFRLGDLGLGYYLDSPPQTAPLLTPDSVQQCGSHVLRALAEQQRKLEKLRGTEASKLDACTMESIEAKLSSVRHQVHLLRLMKDSHVAECSVILKSSVQADVEADLRAAAEHAPVALTSPDVLRKRIEQLKQQAQGVRSKKRYMHGRLQEAHQLAQNPAPLQASSGSGAEEGQPAASSATAPSLSPVAHDVQGSNQLPVDGQGEAGGAVRPPAAGQSSTLECPVCYGTISEDIIVFGACGHSFCKNCAPKLVLERGECAVCRTKVTAKQVYRVAAAGGLLSSEQCDPDSGEAAQEHVVGGWSIKLQAVLRRILAMAQCMPQEKCLVFSQFPDALKLLGRALDVNGVRYVQLAGSKQAVRDAIKCFNDDEDIRVFLLSHRAGATGLTLVRANHVFLLEPALEPSIEQQAIARVHRIGQMRPVFIHRLLVRGSIEDQVINIQESKHALFVGEHSDNVTTVTDPVKNEMILWGEMQAMIDALL